MEKFLQLMKRKVVVLPLLAVGLLATIFLAQYTQQNRTTIKSKADTSTTFTITVDKQKERETPDTTLTVEPEFLQDGMKQVESTLQEVNTTTPSPTPSDPNAQIGKWSDVMNWPLVTVHANLLYTGELLLWDAWETPTTKAVLWNPTTQTFTPVPFNAGGFFCSAHTQLADGNILVMGGYSDKTIGTSVVGIFNPSTKTWTTGTPMKYTRWYPTLTTLSDGRAVILSGTTIGGGKADIPEVYDPINNTTTLLTGVTTPQLREVHYPLNFHLPNGKVVAISATTQAVNLLDVNAKTWTALPQTPILYGSAVQYSPGKILMAGGGTLNDTAQTKAAVIDLNVPNPAWRMIDPMQVGRYMHNFVVLPDGKILAIGGASKVDQRYTGGTLVNEIWDPETEKWTTVASMQKLRMYHAIAILLPDGRVLAAGGGRLGGLVNQPNAEIYSPPYLFKGPRPTITNAPAQAYYGEKITVGTPDSATIAKATIISLGSVTHELDEHQFSFNLNMQKGTNELTIDTPQNATIAPPGYYMLFIINNEGVPSSAKMIKLSEAPQTPTNGLQGYYYNNKYTSGAPAFIRTDKTVNFNWGTNAPHYSISQDNFSAIWQGYVVPQYSQTYTFYTNSDDGVKLWVNGKLLINNWTIHSPTENKGAITLQAGQKYAIRMQYFEALKGATAQLFWSSPSTPKQIIPESRLFPSPAQNPPAGLRGYYYANKTLSGFPTFIRDDATVNFNWRAGKPYNILPVDNFSVRWEGYVTPQNSETYTFYTHSDDGVRLWVDGKLLIDNWTIHANKEDKGTITLTGGKQYAIRMEYFESLKDAVAELWWSSPSTPKQIIPQSRLATTWVSPATLSPTTAPTQNITVTAYADTATNSGKLTIKGQNTSSNTVTLQGTLLNAPDINTLAMYTKGQTGNYIRKADVIIAGGTFSIVVDPNSTFVLTTLPILTPTLEPLTSPTANPSTTNSPTLTPTPSPITSTNSPPITQAISSSFFLIFSFTG